LNNIQNELKQTQSSQIAIFSAILAMLTFVITNTGILASASIDIWHILIINFSYILVCIIFFTFILFFLPDYKFTKNRRNFSIILIIILFIIVLGISIYAKYFNKVNNEKSNTNNEQQTEKAETEKTDYSETGLHNEYPPIENDILNSITTN
jgi:glucan phosphoethanolaminetransferase (alkaline phosphatase superfamily)